MTALVNTKEFPPRGWLFYQPEIKWRNPDPMLPLSMVARNLQQARANNPASGLDPSYEACVEAIGQYTCARFTHNPELFDKFCTSDEALARQAVQQRVSTAHCGSCGR